MSGGASLTRAVLTLFAAIICFDLMSVMVKIMSAHYSPQELSAYRNVLGVIPSLLLMMWTGELRLRGGDYRTGNWPLAIGRGVSVALAQLCLYTALTKLELATIAALGQTNGFFVVLVSILILGERVGPWRWGALIVGFAGAIWIIRPGGDTLNAYAILPVLAAALYAYSVVTVRQFPDHVSNALLYLYSSAAAAVGAIALAALTTEFTPIASLWDAARILAMSLCGGVGVLFIMLAYRMAPPSAVAPFNYFGILTAFILGWVIFGEAPVETLFPGVILIVGAGAVIIWRERRR